MGLFGGIGKAVGGAVGMVPGGGMLTHSLFGLGGQPGLVQPGGADLSQVILAQKNQANQFRQNIPGMAQGMYTQYSDQAKQGLAGQLQGIKQNASSRGLLYSGLQAGQQAGAQGAAASNAAAMKTNINTQLQNQADKMDAAAVQGGLGMLGNNMQMQQSAYDAALQQAKGGMAGMGAFGQGLGAMTGLMAAAGGGQKQTPTQTAQPTMAGGPMDTGANFGQPGAYG